MNAKRKPTKPVKAWAYVHRFDPDAVHVHPLASRGDLRHWAGLPGTEWNLDEWRIARVEIREVGR